MKKRTPTLGIALSATFVKNAPEKAPTHIKPACPRLSSPKIPTVKFKETARITYIQIGTRSPFARLLKLPVFIMIWITAQNAITIP